MALDFGLASNVAMMGVMGDQTYKKDRGQGSDAMTAGKHAFQAGFWGASLSLYGAAALPLAAALPGAIARGVARADVNTRGAAMPFSHRFEHTEMTGRLQEYSLGRMSEMEGFGNEAESLYGRYGRR